MKKTSFIRHTVSVLGLFTLAASVHAMDGYLIDSAGMPVQNAGGDCWRTGSWSPAMTNAQCDPHLIHVHQHATAAVPITAVVVVALVAPTPAEVQAENPVWEKKRLQAEMLFDFDQATLRPRGEQMLIELSDALQRYPRLHAAVISGHADRLGSLAYNQQLSERRAEAVKRFLIERGIPSEQIETRGKGETEPVTQADQCKGSRDMIACLQPDRRVEVAIWAEHEVRK